MTAGTHINAAGTAANAGVHVPQINGSTHIAAPGTTAGVGTHVPGTTAGIGANAAGAGAHTAFRVPTTGANATANVPISGASNFRAHWANAATPQLQGVHGNLSSALRTSAATTAATRASTNVAANAAANAAATNAAANVGVNNFAAINPGRANFWNNVGSGLLNTAVFGNPYGAYGAYGGYGLGGYGYGGYPYFGGNFFSGRNLIGLGVMSALGGGYGGYGMGGYGGYGGYGGMGNWWGYSPWLGNQPYGYWYGNPGWGTFANMYGWNSPYFYDYGQGGNVVYSGNQVLVNDQPVGTPAQYAQSAAELAQVTPEEMNAPHDWMPLGTFAVATSQEDKNPVRVAQLAYDNKQGLVSGTMFNKESGNLYTLQGKVDPQTQRVAFTIGNDPNTVMETGLYNLTQNTTPVLTHFGPEQTATYVFARLPEPKEGEQSGVTANAGAPPADDLRR